MHRELKPPSDPARYHVNVDWKMEFDVLDTVRELGHELEVLGLSGDVAPVSRAIARFRPGVLLNLLEDFHDIAVYDQNWVGYLELLGIPYTGCGPRGLMLARDKALSKKLLSYEGVRVPAARSNGGSARTRA